MKKLALANFYSCCITLNLICSERYLSMPEVFGRHRCSTLYHWLSVSFLFLQEEKHGQLQPGEAQVQSPGEGQHPMRGIPCRAGAERGHGGAAEFKICGMTAASHSPFTCTKDVFSLLFFLTVLVC